MLGKLGQSLKNLWFSLFGKHRVKTLAPVSQSSAGEVSENKFSELTDEDLEFLFHQLLEGVVHGWQDNRIERFFHKVEDRITMEKWLTWLKRFAQKILSSPVPNYQLAGKMMTLGEVSVSSPLIRPVGDLAYRIGEELLNRSNDSSFLELQNSIVDQDNQQLEEYAEEPESSGFFEEAMANSGEETSNLHFIVEKLLEQKETSIAQLARQLENWFEVGLQQAKEGNLEEAIASWDKVLEHDPHAAQAWHNRGSALAYLDHLEEAIASFERAIALNVNDYQSWNDRGNVLYNLHRWEEALNSWDRAVGIKADYYQAWYNRGLALENLKLTQEALESYEQALAIEPEFKLAETRKNKLLANHESSLERGNSSHEC